MKTANEFIRDFKVEFEKNIETKNSWGKNEVMRVFRECLTNKLIEAMTTEEGR